MSFDAPTAIDYSPGFDAEKIQLPMWEGVVPDNLLSHFGIDKRDADNISARFWLNGDGSYAASFSWMKDGQMQDGRLETYGDPKAQNEKTQNDYPDTTRLTSVLHLFGLDRDLSPLPTTEVVMSRSDNTLR